MDSPCCEMKRHGVSDQVLVCSRQAETKGGLEESPMVRLVIMSPTLYGGGRSRCKLYM